MSLQVSELDRSKGDLFVLLPCRFPTLEPDKVTVVWTRQDLRPPTVHQREAGGDALEEQNQLYRGRTSMKQDLVESGDLSLKLSHLQLADTGTYTCSVWTSRGQQNLTDVDLQVRGEEDHHLLQTGHSSEVKGHHVSDVPPQSSTIHGGLEWSCWSCWFWFCFFLGVSCISFDTVSCQVSFH